MPSGNYDVKGYAKYTGKDSTETGHDGKFYGSTNRIAENLSHSVPRAGEGCTHSAERLLTNKKYIDKD